jgi:hypothetical protein
MLMRSEVVLSVQETAQAFLDLIACHCQSHISRKKGSWYIELTMLSGNLQSCKKGRSLSVYYRTLAYKVSVENVDRSSL